MKHPYDRPDDRDLMDCEPFDEMTGPVVPMRDPVDECGWPVSEPPQVRRFAGYRNLLAGLAAYSEALDRWERRKVAAYGAD